MFSLRDLKEGDMTTNFRDQSRQAYGIYRENFILCFGLSLAPAVLMGTLLVLTWNDHLKSALWIGLAMAASLLVFDLCHGAMLRAFGGRGSLGGLLGWSLLTRALVFLAWQAWPLAGVLVALATAHMPHLMMLEGVGGWEALRRSLGHLHTRGGWSYLRRPVREVLVTEHVLLVVLSCWLPTMMSMAAQGLGFGSDHAMTLLVGMCVVESLAMAAVLPWAVVSYLLRYLAVARGEGRREAA